MLTCSHVLQGGGAPPLSFAGPCCILCYHHWTMLKLFPHSSLISYYPPDAVPFSVHFQTFSVWNWLCLSAVFIYDLQYNSNWSFCFFFSFFPWSIVYSARDWLAVVNSYSVLLHNCFLTFKTFPLPLNQRKQNLHNLPIPGIAVLPELINNEAGIIWKFLYGNTRKWRAERIESRVTELLHVCIFSHMP